MKKIWDYKNIDVLEKEFENLYKRFWHFGAHKNELKNNKDYVIFKIYDFEVVIYNDYGNIICFYNICPHRGARLIKDKYDCTKKGNGNILCSYHHWSFSKNTLHIPNRSEFANNLDLFRLKIDYCGNFIFFALKPIMSLKEQLGEFFETIYIISKSINCCIDINDKTKFKSNWKIGVENANESYHINAVHPQSLALFNMQYENIFSGVNSKVIGKITNQKYYKKLKRNKELFNKNNYYQEAYFSYYLFPFCFISSTFGYSYSIQTFFPHTTQNTHFTSRSYAVHSNFDISAFNNSVIKINKQIFDEDAIPTELIQNSSFFDDMAFVYTKQQESRIVDFHKSYNKYIN